MQDYNPAQRLYDILERALDGTVFPRERLCREVWSIVLGAKSAALLNTRLGQVMALPLATLEAIEDRHPGDSRHHQHWVDQICSAFARQNLDAQWQSFKEGVSSTTLANVAMAASALREPGRKSKISDEELASALEALSELRTSAIKMDVPEELKKYLLQQLSRIQIALEEYFISGGLPVVDLIEATIGHFAVRPDGRAFFKTDAGQSILQGLGAVAAAVTIAKDLPQLVYSTAALLVG